MLERLGQRLALDRRVGSLPLGQQQIVEIARAVVHDTRVLMMDEPTSALTASEIPVLFNLIRDLAGHGVGIVYISHRLEELLAVADDVTVLRDGAVVGHAPRADVERRVDRPAHDRARRSRRPRRRQRRASGEPVLAVKDLQLPAAQGRTGLHGVSFDVCPGEILGLYGLMGAGRTEVMESVLGVHEDARGSVRLDGRELAGLDVRERIARGIAMVPGGSPGLGPGADDERAAEHDAGASSARWRAAATFLRRAKRAAAAEWGRSLRLKTPALDAPIGALSGGNQQKVVIARNVMTRPRVLMMDEPTRGVDVAAKGEIVDTMRRLAADGMAVVFATSDLAEIAGRGDSRGRDGARPDHRRSVGSGHDRRGAGIGRVG